MASKNDILNAIEQLKTIQKHLIPIDKIINESEEHISFYHNKAFKELSDNQVVNFYNISEALYPLMDEILDYIDKMQTMTAKNKSSSDGKKFLAINKDILVNYDKVLDVILYGPDLMPYKEESDIYTYIDEVILDLSNFKLYIDDNSVAIEPVVYVFNLYDKSVRKFTSNFKFSLDCSQEIIIVGFKVLRSITSGMKLKVYKNFNFKIAFNNLTNYTTSMELYKHIGSNDYDEFVVPANIDYGSIPFFCIIDLFKNHIEVKFKEATDYVLLQNNAPLNSLVNLQRVKMLRSNNSLDVNISLVDEFMTFKGKSYFYQPYQLGFNLYMSPLAKETIYFPGLARLSLVLQRLIDDM